MPSSGAGGGGLAGLVVTGVECVLLVAVLLTAFAYMTWFERRVLARFQWRLGPNRVGPAGLLQPLADGLKLLFKENIIPARAHRFLFLLAPCIALTVALTAFAFIPWATAPVTLGGVRIPPVVADVNVGLVFLLGVSSLSVYGLVLAGWSSGNRYALLGAIRSSAQVISYELALGVALLSPVMMAGSLRLGDLVAWQEQHGWFLLYQPLAFFIFWIAGVAETNRAPFDLPEAEQELVAGFHTEYSGMRFATFFIAEYVAMFAMAALLSVVFLGGAAGPLGLFDGPWWLALKVAFFMFCFVWLRATFPRFRYDQLMRIGWQVLLPLGLVNLALTALAVALDWPGVSLPLAVAGMVAVLAWLGRLRRRASAAGAPVR